MHTRDREYNEALGARHYLRSVQSSAERPDVPTHAIDFVNALENRRGNQDGLVTHALLGLLVRVRAEVAKGRKNPSRESCTSGLKFDPCKCHSVEPPLERRFGWLCYLFIDSSSESRFNRNLHETVPGETRSVVVSKVLWCLEGCVCLWC